VIVLFPLLAVTEDVSKVVDIIDAVCDVVFKALKDAPEVGLESIVAITTGVFVDSPLVVDGRLFVGGGLSIGGEEFVTEAVESNMIPPVPTYDTLTSSSEVIWIEVAEDVSVMNEKLPSKIPVLGPISTNVIGIPVLSVVEVTVTWTVLVLFGSTLASGSYYYYGFLNISLILLFFISSKTIR
jgi:hypothetical protein